jgi:hypothetical protein|tara:strand:- start:243 stop:488 length:246 start_codon:yes stop_codon:yes gene_type:complete
MVDPASPVKPKSKVKSASGGPSGTLGEARDAGGKAPPSSQAKSDWSEVGQGSAQAPQILTRSFFRDEACEKAAAASGLPLD